MDIDLMLDGVQDLRGTMKSKIRWLFDLLLEQCHSREGEVEKGKSEGQMVGVERLDNCSKLFVLNVVVEGRASNKFATESTLRPLIVHFG